MIMIIIIIMITIMIVVITIIIIQLRAQDREGGERRGGGIREGLVNGCGWNLTKYEQVFIEYLNIHTCYSINF